MLFYDEVFASINGESTDAGIPTIFVRLYGCNVRCLYCDQPQSKDNKKRISVENLLNIVKSYIGIRHVCITGGEPLLQSEVYAVIYDLVDCGYKVSVETSGCVPIDPDPYRRSYKYIMDVKCPSSGVAHKNVLDNLTILHPIDEVKFVVANRKDYDFAKSVLMKYPTMAKILFSPMFLPDNKLSIGKELVDWIIADKLDNVRVQVQLHKILGVK